MWTSQEEMKIRLDALVFRMDAHHAKTEANHEELMTAMKVNHETIEA
jgi:hypothetical protein